MIGTQPDGDEVRVCSAALCRPADEVARLAALLSGDERDRAARYRNDAARNAFVVTRGLLRRLLGDCCAADPRSLRFAYGPAGKPELAGPPGPHFNVSHTDGLALLVLAGCGPVGVDVEHQRPLDVPLLAGSVLSPRERSALFGLPEGERAAAFLRAWTAKEAFVKALGAGVGFGVERVEVLPDAPGPVRLLRLDGSAAAADEWSLWELSPRPGYFAAVAVRGRGWRLTTDWERFPYGW